MRIWRILKDLNDCSILAVAWELGQNMNKMEPWQVGRILREFGWSARAMIKIHSRSNSINADEKHCRKMQTESQQFCPSYSTSDLSDTIGQFLFYFSFLPLPSAKHSRIYLQILPEGPVSSRKGDTTRDCPAFWE